MYREDTVTYTIGLPVTQLIDVIRISDARGMTTGITFAPNVVTLAIGGTVSWRYYQNGWGTDGGPGITFEKPEAASPGDELIPALPWTGGGNIPTVPYCFSSPIVPESLCWPALEGSFVRIRPSRKFLAADTIIYHDELGRSTGTIIVK